VRASTLLAISALACAPRDQPAKLAAEAPSRPAVSAEPANGEVSYPVLRDGESSQAAAPRLGISTSSVETAVRKGQTSFSGEELEHIRAREALARTQPTGTAEEGAPYPVLREGESLQTAALRLGISTSSVEMAVREGQTSFLATELALVRALETLARAQRTGAAEQGVAYPVRREGESWEGASRRLGLSARSVQIAVREGVKALSAEELEHIRGLEVHALTPPSDGLGCVDDCGPYMKR